MHRNGLLQLLYDYCPADQDEIEAKKTITQFVGQNPACFERALVIGHITASAWLLNKEGTHALLMHHAKLDRWVQLGGHCDGDSDVMAVAVKEAQEESGILSIEPVVAAIFDIDVHLIPATAKEQEHYHYDIRFLLRVSSDESIVSNRESKELRWISRNASLLPTQSRSVVRMFEKWCNNATAQVVDCHDAHVSKNSQREL